MKGGGPEVPSDYLLLGRLGRIFGVEGALRFRPLGIAEAEAVFVLEEVFVEGLGSVRLSDVRQHGDEILLHLETVRRRERAKELVNARVLAAFDSLPQPPKGTFYVEALRGMPVLVDGRPFGTVAGLLGPAGAELLAIDTPVDEELLLPLRAPYVQLSEQAILVVDPPPGLFGAEDAI